ncbi:L-threonylcarbamoyladenylate synthase [Anaerosinus massiliensis]|uniref:L-threonylcarbamoyladenylate synthase n=1 Tax=Massilibacillus massiliensis TaxID=1806837 RepID=UPI000A4ADB2F|nr:L-threonylcarbamoyladenylate synthase [Massilibacillus massiliensis]
METKVIKIKEKSDPLALLPAAKILQQGGLVAFPTETVYGLGANGLDGDAVRSIYAAKGRPSDNPLILHVADFSEFDKLAIDISDTARKMIEAFCPGPITLILKRQRFVPDAVTGGLDTVGIRMPNHEVARALIRLAGVPLAAPSANTSGRPSPTNAEAVLADLEGKIGAVIDGGNCVFGLESTIVDCTGEVPTVLRPGAVTMEMLSAVVGEVKLDPGLSGENSVPKAPGMKYTHYAPKAPMVMLEGAKDKIAEGLFEEIAKARAKGKKIGVIVSKEVADMMPKDIVTVVYGSRENVAEIATNLYRALRSFDQMQVDIIFAEGTEHTGLGLAVMNRMHKASGYRIINL